MDLRIAQILAWASAKRGRPSLLEAWIRWRADARQVKWRARSWRLQSEISNL